MPNSTTTQYVYVSENILIVRLWGAHYDSKTLLFTYKIIHYHGREGGSSYILTLNVFQPFATPLLTLNDFFGFVMAAKENPCLLFVTTTSYSSPLHHVAIESLCNVLVSLMVVALCFFFMLGLFNNRTPWVRKEEDIFIMLTIIRNIPIETYHDDTYGCIHDTHNERIIKPLGHSIVCILYFYFIICVSSGFWARKMNWWVKQHHFTRWCWLCFLWGRVANPQKRNLRI